MERQKPESKNCDTPSWRTSDLYLAGFLKARGLNFTRIEHEGRRVFFLFQQNPSLDELIQAFYNDGPIGALTYKGILKNLKEIIFVEIGR